MYLHPKDCESYYCSQVGGGGNSLYFHGIPHQRGYGLFTSFYRHISPLAVRAGRYLGRQLLKTSGNVMSDVASGSTFHDSARKR